MIDLSEVHYTIVGRSRGGCDITLLGRLMLLTQWCDRDYTEDLMTVQCVRDDAVAHLELCRKTLVS